MTPPAPRNRRLIVLGVIAAAAAVVAGVVLWAVAGRRYDQAIEGFARAPVGCDTTLDFERTGRYLLYVETVGSLDDVPGDCDAPSRWDRAGDIPDVELSLLDPNDRSVELTDEDGIDYQTNGFVGTAVRSVSIDDAGLYRLTVQSDAGDVVVAIGRDPSAGTAFLRTLAVIAAAAGLVIAGILLMLGTRRKPGVASADPSIGAAWPTAFSPPTSPPGAPTPMPGSGSGPVVGPPVAPPTAATDEIPRSPWAPPGQA